MGCLLMVHAVLFKECLMHVISQKMIWEAKRKHVESSEALDGWYRVVKRTDFRNFSDLKRTFNSVDKVADLYVFNVGGNKLRVIASVHFSRKRIYIRDVLTHKEYDKNHWKK